MSISNNKIRFYIYAIALMPMIALIASGLVMLKYHTGSPAESLIWGLDGHFWHSFHQVTAIITTILIILHLFVKTNWVNNLLRFKIKGRFKLSNTILFVVFTLCVLTAYGSWLIFADPKISDLLLGIHNKIGLLLIVMFGIHIWNYRKQIINQFKKW